MRSSNAGQSLFTGIVSEKRAAAVAEQLLSPIFLHRLGIRTIASSEARFNPMSYHNGSVWPHDNALIGLGFARYGMETPRPNGFLRGLYGASRYMDLRRPPELFCGLRRTPGKGPTLYPVACSPQAWASAAPSPALLQACLGLRLRFPDGAGLFSPGRAAGFSRSGNLFARSRLARAKSIPSYSVRFRRVGQRAASGRTGRGDGQAIGRSRPTGCTLGMAGGRGGHRNGPGV